MADDITHYDAIEGYVLQPSCLPGEHGPAVRLDDEPSASTSRSIAGGRRASWSGRRRISPAASSRRRPTPTPPVAGGSRSSRSRPSASWRSGFYLVTMTAHDAPADRAVSLHRVRRPRRWRRGGPCSCSPRTRGTPTTTGAGAASTPVARRCRSAVPGGAGCSCVPMSIARTASRRRDARARSPTSTATCTRNSATSTDSPATWARPDGSPTTAASSSGPERAGSRRLDYAISSDLEQVDGPDRRLPARDRRRSRRVLVGGRPRHDRALRRRRWQLRLVLRQHDVLAGAPRA